MADQESAQGRERADAGVWRPGGRIVECPQAFPAQAETVLGALK